MNAPDTIRRMAEANPVPDPGKLHPDPADAERLFSSIERRRDEMIGTQTQSTPSSAPAPQPRPWYRRPVVVFLVAIAAVFMVAVPLVIFAGGGSEVTETPATTAPSPEVATTLPPTTLPPTTVPGGTSTTPATDAPVLVPSEVLTVPAALMPAQPEVPVVSFDPTQMVWRRIEVPDSLFANGQYASPIVALESRLVLLGREECDGQRSAAVWVSDDGYTWSQVADDPVFQLTPPDSPQCPLGFRDVVVGGPGLVAVGDTAGPGPHHAFNATVWISSDGLSWSRLSPDGANESMIESTRLRSVYLGGPGLVAIGDSATWTSPDGLTWTRVEDLDPAFASTLGKPGGLIDTVAANANGLVGISPTPTGLDFWTSRDRITWTRVPREDASPQGCFQWLGSGLAASDQGFVATRLCNRGPSEYSQIWTSVDGQKWNSTTLDSDVVIGDVVGIGSSFVAVGSTGQASDGSARPLNPAIWTSTDGTTWIPVELDVTNAGSGSISSVALGGPGLVASGWSPEGPTLWVATPSS